VSIRHRQPQKTAIILRPRLLGSSVFARNASESDTPSKGTLPQLLGSIPIRQRAEKVDLCKFPSLFPQPVPYYSKLAAGNSKKVT
jgi:hypothetical protein